VDVLTPHSLDEALALKAEHPDAVPIQGGTDLMVELNFDRARPETILNLNEVAELRGWTRENGTLRLGAGLTYTEAMEAELAGLLPALAEASRTVGSPQIRMRGTIGGSSRTPRSSWRAPEARGRCRSRSSSSARRRARSRTTS
jgi:CO/xanthine dehydrogenase FAD-binding subunit